MVAGWIPLSASITATGPSAVTPPARSPDSAYLLVTFTATLNGVAYSGSAIFDTQQDANRVTSLWNRRLFNIQTASAAGANPVVSIETQNGYRFFMNGP